MLRSLTRRQRVGGAILVLTGVSTAMNCGDAQGPNQPITEITVNAAADNLDKPLDATPSPLGKDIYFIASGAGGPGIFHVPAGGGTVDELHVGAPLVSPRGIATSPDGAMLYVADSGAGVNGDGAVFQLPVTGDTPVVVPGTEGTHPTSLDVVEESSKIAIYFTGAGEKNTPEVLSLPVTGGTPSVLAQGAPLAKPNGIVVTSSHKIFVADLEGGAGGKGQVFTVAGGKVTALGPAFKAGDPTGIASTLDETKLLVSSLAADGTSQVLILNLAENGASSTFNDVIKQNKVSGGLHRARAKDIYAWAGFHSVYAVKVRVIYADSSTPGGVGG